MLSGVWHYERHGYPTEDSPMSRNRTDDPEQAMNTQAVAALLDVSKATVRRRVDEGQLPAVRVGRCLRFRRSQVLAYMTANTTATR